MIATFMRAWNMTLTIELVPSTCFYTNVRSEVSKDEWDVLRRKCYADADYKCEICGGVGPKHPVEAHEVWEYDDKNKVQKLLRLIALCPKCHMCKHWGLSQIRNKEGICIKHMMQVNGWSKEDVKLYVEASFEKWMQRSQHDWELDISWLDNYLEEDEKG